MGVEPVMGLVFTTKLLLSPSLSSPTEKRPVSPGPSETAVSTSTGEVLTKAEEYRLLDLGLPAPALGGEGCLSMWPVVWLILRPEASGRCAEPVEEVGPG